MYFDDLQIKIRRRRDGNGGYFSKRFFAFFENVRLHLSRPSKSSFIGMVEAILDEDPFGCICGDRGTMNNPTREILVDLIAWKDHCTRVCVGWWGVWSFVLSILGRSSGASFCIFLGETRCNSIRQV